MKSTSQSIVREISPMCGKNSLWWERFVEQTDEFWDRNWRAKQWRIVKLVIIRMMNLYARDGMKVETRQDEAGEMSS